MTSYDTQPNAVAPSDSPPSGLEAFRIDSAVLAAKARGVRFDVGHGQGARIYMERASVRGGLLHVSFDSSLSGGLWSGVVLCSAGSFNWVKKDEIVTTKTQLRK
eukprot:COSAG02_NODE_37330_length_443_cov_0.901163_1_plen_103_part_10